MKAQSVDLRLFSERCVLGGVDEPRRIAPARLDIAAGRLVAVTQLDRAALLVERTEGAVVDLGDSLVTPAFVNGHTHLAMAAFRGLQGSSWLGGNVIEDLYYRLESGLTAEDVRAFARLGAYESLLAGVATVFDHYYFGEACAEALMDVGITGVVAPTLQDLAGPGSAEWERQLLATAAIDDSERFAAAGVFAALGPHATDTVSADLWRRAAEIGEKRRIPVHAHAAQSFEELSRCQERHGLSPIAWLSREGVLRADVGMLLVHVIYATDADLALLAADRHVLGYCPFSQLEFCFPAAVASWQRSGLRWLLGTDCAPSNDSMNVQKELRIASGMSAFATTYSAAQRTFQQRGGAGPSASLDHVRRANLKEHLALRDPQVLLDQVWSVPGGWHPRLPCGAIEPGRWANLLVLNSTHPSLWPLLDPWRALTLSEVAPAIEAMVIAGRFVGERGDFHRSIVASPEYQEALREADQRLTGHLRRLGLRDSP